MAELHSCYQYNGDVLTKKNRFSIDMNMSLDKAILHLESCLITKYAFDNYPDDLVSKNTFPKKTETSISKYSDNRDVDAETIDFKDDTKRETELRKAAGKLPLMGPQDYMDVKKCSDILAFIEFYLNRLTSLNDELIKSNMTSARHLLAQLVDFKKYWSFRDNPLIFKVEGKNKTSEPYDDLCNVGSDLFPLYDYERKTNPQKKNIFFHDELNVAKGYDYVGFGDIFALIEKENNLDLYVSLEGDLPDEISSAYESYWKERNEKQLKTNTKLIPLDVLISCLTDYYEKGGSPLDRQLRYVIERDVNDFRYDTLSPLNPFIGHIAPRDDDFETSHSSTSGIYRYDEKYSKKVIVYTRILHSIILDSKIISEKKKQFILSFNPSMALLRMMDPCIFDRNYPPTMLFDRGSKDYLTGYADYLCRYKGYRKGSDKIYLRQNDRNPIAIDWPDTEGNSKNIWEREDEETRIPLIYSKDNDPEILSNIIQSESKNNQVIIVTNRDSVFDAEKMISAVGGDYENIHYIAVFGDNEYMSIRYDFHDIAEVGIKDMESLYRIHRNGLDQRKINAIDSVLDCIEAKWGAPGDRDLIKRLDHAKEKINGNDLTSVLVRSFVTAAKDQI